LTVLEGFEAVSLRPLTRLGWDANDVRSSCERVKLEFQKAVLDPELQNKSTGLYITVKVLVGRKPRVGEEVALEEDSLGKGRRGPAETITQHDERDGESSRYSQLSHDNNDCTSEDTATTERDMR